MISKNELLFERIVLGTKICAIVLLGFLAMMNKKTQYIMVHPNFFIEDALLLGLSSALGALFIGKLRTGKYGLEGAFLTFLFFFMYSVLREMSGYFNFMRNTELTEKEKKLKHNYSMLLKLIVACVSIACVVLIFMIRKFPDSKTYKYLTKHTMLMFFLETVVFTLITAIPEDIIDKRHESMTHIHSTPSQKTPAHGKNTKNTQTKKTLLNSHKSNKSHNTLIQTLLMFAGLHAAFQFGGLYNVFFAT